MIAAAGSASDHAPRDRGQREDQLRASLLEVRANRDALAHKLAALRAEHAALKRLIDHQEGEGEGES